MLYWVYEFVIVHSFFYRLQQTNLCILIKHFYTNLFFMNRTHRCKHTFVSEFDFDKIIEH